MLLDAMEKHHVRSITWVSFFLPLIRILVHTAYKLSITRSSSSCPRTALLVLLFMLRFGQSREIVVTSSVPWARITEITGHEAGWLPSFTQQPTSFHRRFIVRLATDSISLRGRGETRAICSSAFQRLLGIWMPPIDLAGNNGDTISN